MEPSEKKSLLSKSESNNEKSSKSKVSEMKSEKKVAEKSNRSSNEISERSMVTTQTEGGTMKKRPKIKMDDGKQFEKGPLGWLLSVGYMIGIWSIGAVVMAIMMYFLLKRVEKGPLYFGKNTFIGSTPVIVFEPNPTRFDKKVRGLIEFNMNDLETYQNYLVRYKKMIKSEYNPKRNVSSCDTVSGSADGSFNKTTCVNSFEDQDNEDSTNEYGECALTMENLERADLGFSTGHPCIMLRLTRILGWYPEFKNETKKEPSTTENPINVLPLNFSAPVMKRSCPDGSENCCHFKRITFSCKVSDGASFVQYPSDGMNTCGLPYWNQPGYQSPFVMMQFKNVPTNGTEVSIKCWPNLESIAELDSEKSNEVKFKLKIRSE